MYHEEVLVHEAAHVSLDDRVISDPKWKAAQTADGAFISTYAKSYSQREDVAESFLAYFAARYVPSRISRSWETKIFRTIPNRIAYFDALLSANDMKPFTRTSPRVAGLEVDESRLKVDAGAAAAYDLRLLAPPDAAVTVTPASSDEKVATVSGPLTFTASNWHVSQTVTVTGAGGGQASISHTTASSDGDYKIGDATLPALFVTVAGNPVSLSVSGNGAIAEGGSALTVTAALKRANATGAALAIPVRARAAGTTAAAGDYSLAGTISVADGARSGTADFAVVDDNEDEPGETVVVELGSPLPAGLSAGAADHVTIVIADNDATAVTLTVPDATATEGDATDTASIALTLNRRLAAGESLAVPLAFAGGVLGTDFTLSAPSSPPAGVSLSGSTVTFAGPTGAASVTLTLGALADGVASDRTVTVSIPSSSTGTGAKLTATGLGGGAVGTRTGDGRITLEDSTPDGADDASPDYTDYQTVVNYLIGVRDNPENTDVKDDPAHIAKWNRVLAAIGHDSPEEPMPASDIHANAEQWPDSPFKAASVYLNWVEAQGQQDQQQPKQLQQDLDEPEIAVSAGGAVTEGGDAVFTLTATPVPVADLAVSVTVATDGDYGIAAGSRTVTIPTSGSATLTLATTGDGADEADGSVTVTVKDGDGYTVGSSASGSVTVQDDDEPEVTVAAVTSSVTEGGDAAFTLTANPVPASPLAVTVTVAADGDWGVTAGSRTVTIPTTGSATLTLATADDGADEPDGSVSVTVTDGNGYTVGSPASNSVTVRDDDDASPDYTDYQTVVNYLIEVRDNPKNTAVKGNPAHIRKWNRVLEAVGHDTGTSVAPMAASDIHANAEQWPDSPFKAASVYLKSQEQEQQQDEPAVTVSAGTSPVTEGGSAVFTLTADPAPATDLAVSVTVATAGDYGITAGERTITIPTSGSAVLTLATTGDGADEAHGSVTVTVKDGDGYTVGSSASGSVTVQDDDEPAVTVAAVTSSVTEGGDAAFTLTANPVPAADLPVTVTVAADGDWGVTAGSRTVTIPTTGSAVLTLATTGDDADEAHGSVSVTVTDGNGYTVGSSATATVAVQDDDEAPPPPDETALPGTVAAALSNGVVTLARPSGWTGSGKIQFGGGPAKARDKSKFTALRIENADDDSFEVTWASRDPGTLRLTLEWQPVAGSFWRPSDGGAQDPRVLTIEDPAPTKPTVTVTGGGAVTEGTGAGFTVSRTGDASAALTVLVAVSEDGTGGRDFVAPGDEGDKQVVIQAGSAQATYTVPTGSDGTDEPDGEVTLTLRADNAYTSGSPSSATVTVQDDDGAPPLPVVTVSAKAGSVTEGGDAVFTLTANPAPAADLPVSVTVAATGDFGVTAGSRTVTIPTTGSATLTLATTDDAADEPDGSVTVTVTDGSGWTAGDPASRTVAVRDDDAALPVVTIAAKAASVTEGGGAVFTLTASPAPAAALPVSVTVGTAGDYGISAGTRTVTISTSGSATLTLATTDDAADEPDGSVTATVQAGSGYTVGSAGSGTVAVSDDDLPPPVVTIATKAASVAEGGDAVFTLTVDRAADADLTVTLAVSETGDGDHVAASDEGPATLAIPKGATEAVFTLATVNDDVDEPDSAAVVTVEAGAGYTVGDPASASVEVTDDDAAALPVLSVGDATLKEGVEWLMPFTVRLSAAAPETVTVRVDTRDSTPVSATRRDYWPVKGRTVTFRPGETERTVTVLVYDDYHDEDPETFEVVLSDARGAAIGDGVAVGTIVNDDPLPGAWLARFGRTVAEQALDGIAARMAAPRTAGMQGSIAGQALAFGGGAADGVDLSRSPGPVSPGSLSGAGFGQEAQARGMTMREVLQGSSFSLTGEADSSGGTLAFWGGTPGSGGLVSGSRFAGDRRGNGTAVSLHGETATALLGTDYARGRWLVGFALSETRAEGGYAGEGGGDCSGLPAEACALAARAGDGEIAASLTATIPYAALAVTDRLRLWGAAGQGAGDVTVKTGSGESLSADTAWSMAAAGLRGDLLAPSSGGTGPLLSLTSDAMWVRTSSEKTHGLAASESDVSRLRVGLEGSWGVVLENGGAVTPKLELGARHDGGDAETGFGVELGGGLEWTDPGVGLSLDLSGRTLVAHDDGGLEDRGVSAQLAFDPAPSSGRGLSLSLGQDWGGRASGGLDALFAPEPLEDRTGSTGSGEASSRWSMEAAYGLPAFGGRFTGSPYMGLGLAAGARDYSLGWRLAPEAAGAPDLSFGLHATLRESDAAAPEHTVGVELTARW